MPISATTLKMLSAVGVLYLIMMGSTFSSLGVVIPHIIATLRLNFGEAGFGFTLLALAAGTSSMLPSVIIKRWNGRITLLLGVLTMTSEYSSGMIRTTFIAMPRRWTVLAAKAVTLTGLVLAASAVAVAGSLAAGRLILTGNGLTTARGFAVVSLAHGPTVQAAVGSVFYLALVGLLSLGIAAIVRDSATATGSVLGMLYVAPLVALFLGGEPTWQRWVERYTPTNAGLAILNTTGLDHLAISPWAGLGVLAGWAAAALLTAGVLLRLRDA